MPKKRNDLSDLVQAAARDLPEGWEVILSVEQGCGDVTLFDPRGNAVEFVSNHESIEETFADAVEHAVEWAAGEGPQP
jgi:hypothetical protein